MKKIQTRFGEIEYNPDKTLYFPEGLIGFESLRNFVVMPSKKEGPLFWIQSVEDPDIAFVLTDPTNFFLNYKVVPKSNELKKLDLPSSDECFTIAVVTIPQNQEITINLAAPILYSPINNKAIQVVLENSDYQTKTPLPSTKE